MPDPEKTKQLFVACNQLLYLTARHHHPIDLWRDSSNSISGNFVAIYVLPFQ